MSEERVRLPEKLAELSPGPELAAVVAGIDPTRLNGHDLVNLAPAYVKLISHWQAGLATVINQLHYSPAGGADSPVARAEQPQAWSEVELAAKLHWTVGKASYELRYAYHMTRRLPIVHTALAAGIIDFPRARTIVDGVACLDQEPAEQIARHVLAGGAAGWNTKQLAARVRRQVIAYEPAAAARRQRLRQAERRVQAEPHPDGTTDLYGLNLPPERVAAIVERVTAIARAAKRLGDLRTMDQLKADALCDLLVGTGIGATPPGPLFNPGPTGHPDRTPAAAGSGAAADGDAGRGGGGDYDAATGGQSGSAQPGGAVAAAGVEGDQRVADRRDPDDAAGLGERGVTGTDDPAFDGSTGQSGSQPGGAAASPGSPSRAAAPAPSSQPIPSGQSAVADQSAALVPLPGPRRGVVELQAPISSLVGWSQAPGQLDGWRPVIADICRQILAADPEAQWRYSIYDDHSHQLLFHGITHARPITEPDPGRNGFSAADTAFVRARDRTCRGPNGCRTPASACEIDHSLAKVDGGGHTRDNAGPLCKREHRFKHESGATLRQPTPGTFEWTTPHGHHYTVKSEPYDESTGPPAG